jgi:hypothetical protein
LKQKVGTVIEAEILRRAKRQAVDEGRPLSDLIQDALEDYLAAGSSPPDEREAAYRVFCELPMRVSAEQFREILQSDPWDP